MNIAFISYEYPPETGGGGIGTYLFQCVRHFPKYGHTVVVFCGTSAEEPFWENENVYRIPSKNWEDFNILLPVFFDPVHKLVQFDVMEGTDYKACGIKLISKYPEIPFVTRAHSSGYIVDIFLHQSMSISQAMRFISGHILRLKWPRFPRVREEDYSEEHLLISQSAYFLSPSYSLGELYKKLGWRKTYDVLPYLFSPSPELINIPLDHSIKDTVNILFLGRLEVRKGILTIIKAIPFLMKKHSNLVFYFVGKSAQSPIKSLSMKDFILRRTAKFSSKIKVKDAVPNSETSTLFQMADIVLIPSLFDNFPLACMEAMAGGKAVVGSRIGGMAEMIEENISGLLVQPTSVDDVVEKVDFLICHPDKRLELGRNARERICKEYCPEIIVAKQIAYYRNVKKKLESGNK